ncbi:AAA family ATPase [Phenylobacterium montanum]|uniref:AAA family ATPase n=1 Tax=Phenylobacterium montanum TaxID=2823693 RepID=A0A975FXW2_9CAUL|nr:AAA family ATPase [Caulobacter sp. S6]QUD87171.1 AAA family ATPase [Caulobacter sp. S6]
MRRYILTGAPGAGKTSILRALECEGCCVVEEAATHHNELRHAMGVAEPHLEPDFIESITALQLRRIAAAPPAPIQFHDRSPVCTLALCRLLDRAVPPILAEALARIAAEGAFEQRVLFVAEQGFVTPTAVRRISHAEALRFEALHREAYLERGYDLVEISRGPLPARVAQVKLAVGL